MNAGHLPLLLAILLSIPVFHICIQDVEEVAYNKRADQSSLKLENGLYQLPHFAVDGGTDFCAHTNREPKPWWMVDIIHIHSISSVAVTNREDCCYDGIDGAEIRMGYSKQSNGSGNPLCAQIPSIPGGGTTTFQCHGMQGRYVSISFSSTEERFLSLCEVKVYAHINHEDVCTYPWELKNPWRNIGYEYTGFSQFPRCDKRKAGWWVQFLGISGDVLPESCIGSCCSGSSYSAYLGFPHPRVGEGIKTGVIHLKSKENCSTNTVNNIQVLACPQGHYVYRLPEVECSAVFATRHSDCTTSSCGPGAACTVDGGCVCIPGYEVPEDILPTDEALCLDINECEDEPNLCGPNANCINTPGAYDCPCHQGYREITPVSIASSLNPCEDVDECLEDLCGAHTVCHNTAGSYYCTCKDGYVPFSGVILETGTTECKRIEDYLDSLHPPENQTRELFFLCEINNELEETPDIVLPEMTVAALLSMTMFTADIMLPLRGKKLAETINIVLKVSEGLASILAGPESLENSTEFQKTLRTQNIEINVMCLKGNMTKIPSLAVKRNRMSINLAAVARCNNGSASAILMSVQGIEKFMRPSFFDNESITEINSNIITAVLPKMRCMELPERVNFTMHHKKQFEAGLVACVYWKENGTDGSWSGDGCEVSSSNQTHTVCSCTHLSTFALLLQTKELEVEDPILETVNMLCMCVGLAFLAIAILTFLLCTWNPKINNTARLHLCICLFTGHLLFLVGVSRTEDVVGCAVIAGTLHLLFLAGYVWMLLETLQLFLLVRSLTKVQVIQKEGLKALHLLLIGYGTPVVVVGVSAAVFSDGYGSKNSCWLKKEKSFHWSFLGPVAAILSINLVSFCVILWSLRPTLASMKSDISQSKDSRLIIFKIAAQFFILGCAWILGFFQNSAFFKYLFIVLNSQQGTFIFIVHCLLNREVREEYKKWFSCLCRTKKLSGSEGSRNSVSTVQK